MVNRVKFTAARKARFLASLRATANITLSAQLIGMNRHHLRTLRHADPAFAAEWENAVQEGVDALEHEARRRALEGVREPLVSMGKLVKDDNGEIVYVQRYSDRLMEVLLRAHRPEKYRDRQEVEHTGLVIVDTGIRRIEKSDDGLLPAPPPIEPA